jgi:hypothetical protein
MHVSEIYELIILYPNLTFIVRIIILKPDQANILVKC